jgi:hypothetical protein
MLAAVDPRPGHISRWRPKLYQVYCEPIASAEHDGIWESLLNCHMTATSPLGAGLWEDGQVLASRT